MRLRRSACEALADLVARVGAQRGLAALVVVVGVVRGGLAQRRSRSGCSRRSHSRRRRTGPARCPTTRQTMLAAISIGLPRLSLTFSVSLVTLRTRRTDLLAAVPGQHPAQAGPAVGADIGSEQGDDIGLVGLQRVEAQLVSRNRTISPAPTAGSRGPPSLKPHTAAAISKEATAAAARRRSRQRRVRSIG